ncbi:SUKH-4 family immunity protein [Kitasatospora sp. NPDC059146]|uniref:SUKH-4 family immunity protein n=1 Tax=Kitasatospora sp. NPDC059146 TaxID=3346741 RepID=UPI0036906348
MRDRAREILARPQAELVVPTDRTAVEDPLALNRWLVPARDRAALERWGLPLIERYGLVSNIHAGERPDELEDGRGYYGLGIWLDLELAAAVPSGQVWGIPLTQWRQSDVFVNSSISGLIDSAWRWYWISGIINSADSIDRYACLRDLFEFIVKRDADVAAQRHSLWREVLLGG